jgi:hypothetical protein
MSGKIIVTNTIIGNNSKEIRARFAVISERGENNISNNIIWTNCKKDAIAWLKVRASNAGAAKGQPAATNRIVDTKTGKVIANQMEI